MARHVHADLYEEAVNDTSIEWQYKDHLGNWFDVSFYFGLSESIVFHSNLQYRKKPREFQEGHWYQCLCEDEEYCFMYAGDVGFFNVSNNSYISANTFDWIGESLGKLKFGE